MPKFFDYLKPLGMGNPVLGKYKNFGSDLLFGTPEKRENVSTLRPEQEAGFQDLQNAAQGNYGNGAFGKSGNYYNNLLSDDSADFNAFAAPQLRQYNQDIMPEISEQFAGMGSGGLASSGFRNAQVQGATDLSERLGAIRANLRQQGAQGLQNIGQLGLGNFSQNTVTEPGTEGLLAPALGAVTTALGAPGLGALGTMGGNWLKNSFGSNKVGAQTGPYGSGGPKASPTSSLQMPNFLSR